MTKHAKSISIIGSGNVAYHLSYALFTSGYSIIDIFGRDHKTTRALATRVNANAVNQFESLHLNVDIVIICVSDDAICSVAQSLPLIIRENKLVVHTSGSKDIDKTLSSCHLRGSFYPIQSFVKGKQMKFQNIPICVTANQKQHINTLFDLASDLSLNVHTISDDQRAHVHLAAVMINNFVNHLIYKSQLFLSKKKLDKALLDALLTQTALTKIDRFTSQTGPARRKDMNVIKSHQNQLENDEDLLAIYNSITNSIINTYKQ